MTTKTHPYVKSARSAFSLVEALVVIAVIGIIAAIAVPTIGSITEQANNNKVKRSVQNVASVWSSANNAGAPELEREDVKKAVQQLVAGVKGSGSWSESQFQVSEIPDRLIDRVCKFLKFEAQEPEGDIKLVYVPKL